MSAVETLALAKAHGVTIKLDGADLELIADRKPDQDLLDAIAGCKAEIIAFLHPKPEVDYALVYRTRIKQLGDDAHKQESQLRALEATVNLYRNNHPGADIDEANAAVRAAIARNSTQETAQ